MDDSAVPPTPAEKPALDRHARMTVGLIVERRKTGNPWQEFTWRPIEVVVGAPPLEPWSIMRHDGDATQFFAGTHEIELHPRETENYRYNLMGEEPSVYVVLRFDGNDGSDRPVVHLVTVSYADGQAYMEGWADQVDRVPMPDVIAAWMIAYIEAYHVERPFHKRQRQKLDPQKVGFGDRGGAARRGNGDGR